MNIQHLTSASVLRLKAFFRILYCSLFSKPEIIGSPRFQIQVCAALRLLKTHDPKAYALVRNYVGRIQEGEHSGMWAFKTPSTFEISARTTFYSVTWCAATIAHDAFHAKLYHDYRKAHDGQVPDNVWTGKEVEQECMKQQLAVMAHIGASERELCWAIMQADGHYLDGNENHERRKW
jgi:hypothetical protein